MKVNKYFSHFEKYYLKPLETTYTYETARETEKFLSFLYRFSLIGKKQNEKALNRIEAIKNKSVPRDWFESCHI